MNTYVIRNMEDHPVILQFSDGSRCRLNSGQHCSYTGNDQECTKLQPIVNEGSIEVFLVNYEPSSKVLKKKKPIDFSWLKEGF